MEGEQLQKKEKKRIRKKKENRGPAPAASGSMIFMLDNYGNQGICLLSRELCGGGAGKRNA